MSALNSLSAQYTDSEGEDEPHLDRSTERPVESAVVSNNVEPVEHVDESSNSNIERPARLVSYIGEDEQDLTDEEEAGSVDMDISRSEDETAADDLAQVGSGPADPAQVGTGATAAADELIPPEPAGRCSRELQEMVSRLCEDRLRSGADMNDRLRGHKDFRNPSIYEKLIMFCGIDEFGTNYPPELYDPSLWGRQSYYDELARVQKEDMERRERERKDKTKVEVVTGTKKLDGGGPRRSKWDQVGAQAHHGAPLKPAGLAAGLAPAGKAIPAFGSIAGSAVKKK